MKHREYLAGKQVTTDANDVVQVKEQRYREI
jgi:hypothetical protein